MVFAILPTCPKANWRTKRELVQQAEPKADCRNGMATWPASPWLPKLLEQVEYGPPPQAARAIVRLLAAAVKTCWNPLLTVFTSFRLTCLHSCRPWLPV